MVQKVLLQIEIDDANLDAAQVKADKLVATLNKAEEIAARLAAKEKPPESGKTCKGAGNVEVKDWTPPDGYGSCAHAWDANIWKQAADAARRGDTLDLLSLSSKGSGLNADLAKALAGQATTTGDFIQRLVIARTLAKKATADAVDKAVDDAITRTAQDIFKPPN